MKNSTQSAASYINGVLLATSALDTLNLTQMAVGSFAEECTGHISLRFIQSNLQHSELATSELLVEAERRKIAIALATPRRRSVEAAIIILDRGVEVEEDQTFIDENVTAATRLKPETAGLASCRCISKGPYPSAHTSIACGTSLWRNANRALAHVYDWGVRNKLRFALSKINLMMLTECSNTTSQWWTIDRKLTFIPDVVKASNKATNIKKGLARAAKAT
ncbi:hypothetical protein EVAR_44469_1 [Eumeta japonica]|uniref:Uncharacterized protein n=1 Tax=Eumeta variegata TaxID=151549 RepID=A0A4C1WMZ8_EUMVA|nr:hypothetical protein EVAR_44469_1 [Eumeta japonica]